MELNEIVINKTKEPNDYEKIMFVIKALSLKGFGTFTSVIHAERTRKGSRIIGTDGKRIHIAEIDEKIPAGNYIPRVNGYSVCFSYPQNDIQYPSWKNVLPDNPKFKTEIDLFQSYNGSNLLGAEKLSIAYNTLIGKTGRAVNIKYLSDLSEHKWKVYSESEKSHPLVLKDYKEGDSLFAVIAPLAM